MKKVLIPNGSFHDIPLIMMAKKMGLYVITSGMAPYGIGHKYADKYIYGDFSDVGCMLKISEQEKIDFICSNCNDFGYISACYVAEKLGLPGHESFENALILHHKDLFKKFAFRYNICSPIAKSFNNIQDAEEYVGSSEVQYPIIIKPTDLGAGQGIHRANNVKEAKQYINVAINISKSKKIVIEPFIEGTAHSFNAFVVNKKVVGWYSDNEYMKYSDYRVSTSLGPADYIDEVKELLVKQTELVAEKLELTDGIVHSQYILDKSHKPHILEITRRMSGDWYPYPEERATGINWVEYIVKAQCGMDCSDFPHNSRPSGYTGRHCLNGPHKGIVKEVIINRELERYVYDKIMWIDEGYAIENVDKDYPGILFLNFDSEMHAKSMIENIDDYLEFVY